MAFLLQLNQQQHLLMTNSEIENVVNNIENLHACP